MTPLMQETYNALVQNAESTVVKPDGSKWGVVYLSNVGSSKAFAAVLSSLKKIGLYRQQPDEHYFGYVRLP